LICMIVSLSWSKIHSTSFTCNPLPCAANSSDLGSDPGDCTKPTMLCSDLGFSVVTGPNGGSQCLWPPNHKYVSFSYVLSSDLYFNVAGVKQDCVVSKSLVCPPDNDSDLDDTSDCVYHNDTDTLCVRSERNGSDKNGKIYNLQYKVTVSCSTTDTSGLIHPNTYAQSSTWVITVPHDGRNHWQCISPNNKNNNCSSKLQLEQLCSTPTVQTELAQCMIMTASMKASVLTVTGAYSNGVCSLDVVTDYKLSESEKKDFQNSVAGCVPQNSHVVLTVNSGSRSSEGSYMITVSDNNTYSGEVPIGLIVGVFAGVLVIIVIIVAFAVWKKRKSSYTALN